MKVLLTGGSGYLGSILSRKLLEKGHSVRILDNFLFGTNSIKDIEKQLKSLNDNYIKKSTIAGYNNDNKQAYIKLCHMYDNIDDISETLEDIISKQENDQNLTQDNFLFLNRTNHIKVIRNYM